MRKYLDLLQDVLDNGEEREGRTDNKTLSVFGRQVRYDLRQGFPLLTTKKLHLRSIIIELLWFLRGDTNVAYLHENDVSIWDDWMRPDGELGPVYGKQWRSWESTDGRSVDQISQLITGLIDEPTFRRHIVCAWNVGEIDDMALPPCHCLFQFYVSNDGYLSCQLYQRSADIFLGVPFNIASYSLLTMMVAQVCGLKTGEFIHTFGDLHLYENHIEQAKLQLSRDPYPLPTMEINPNKKDIFNFNFEDFTLRNYKYHPHIPADVSV